jgi:hypothetical protein
MWDISTGFCKEYFLTEAKDFGWGDTRLIEGRLLFIWLAARQIHIWDAKQGIFQKVDASSNQPARDLRISGDGSKVFFLDNESIQAWSIWMGGFVGKVMLGHTLQPDSLIVDGSKAWVHNSPTQGWDFGTLDVCCVPNVSPDRPRLDFINGTVGQTASPSRIVDTVNGRVVFQLYGRYSKPCDIRWDDRYLVAGYKSGEVLILDFNNIISQ